MPAIATTPAALENMDPEFQALLSQFGRDVICLALDGARDSATWREPELARTLGAELEAAHCGELDSDAVSGRRYFCFFHSFPGKLGRALATLKAALEKRTLLPLAHLLVAEPEAEQFRVYWPATADLV
jgi:hypothetical protein